MTQDEGERINFLFRHGNLETRTLARLYMGIEDRSSCRDGAAIENARRVLMKKGELPKNEEENYD